MTAFSEQYHHVLSGDNVIDDNILVEAANFVTKKEVQTQVAPAVVV